MSLVAITLVLRLAASTPAPEERAPALVDVLPGRDVGITPYATWSEHANGVRITGIPGAELFIEEALLFDVKSDLAAAVLSAGPITSPDVEAFDLEVWSGDRFAGRLDLLQPSPTLALGPLEGGAVLGVGVRVRLTEDAHDVRDALLNLHITSGAGQEAVQGPMVESPP